MSDPSSVDHLFEQARAGVPNAGAELLTAMLPELRLFLAMHLGSLRGRESVSDVAQSVVGDLLPALPREQFADLASFRAWLRRAARNKLIDRQRYHGAQKRGGGQQGGMTPSVAEELGLVQCLRTLSTPSQAAMGAENARLLERALLRLPEDQRQVVTMARLLGMPHREIAEVLERSEVACRMLLRRGLVNLARELAALDGSGRDGAGALRGRDAFRP